MGKNDPNTPKAYLFIYLFILFITFFRVDKIK